MVEEGTFPVKRMYKGILGSVVTCGAIYVIFFFALAGMAPWEVLIGLVSSLGHCVSLFSGASIQRLDQHGALSFPRVSPLGLDGVLQMAQRKGLDANA